MLQLAVTAVISQEGMTSAVQLYCLGSCLFLQLLACACILCGFPDPFRPTFLFHCWTFLLVPVVVPVHGGLQAACCCPMPLVSVWL